MKRLKVVIAAAFSLALGIPATACAQGGGGGEPDAPRARASGPAFSLGGLVDKVKDRLKGGEAASAPAASTGPATTATAAPPSGQSTSPASPPATSSTAAPASASSKNGTTKAPTQIKEFTLNSKLPANWNDAHCKNLVEPFDITDSALSLAKVQAQAGAKSILQQITGGASKTNTRAEIRKAAAELNWLPGSTEAMLGKQNHDQQSLLREGKNSKDQYARARRILNDVLAPVAGTTPYKFQIFITTQEAGNAESGPGGYIYVDRNLVDSASVEPKARFAIAHEVSHVLQRHRTRETQMRLSDSVNSIEELLALMSTVRGTPDAVMKKGLDTKRMFIKHSEGQELQADGCAVRLLDSTLRDRTEMVKSINAFVADLGKPGPPEPPKKISTEAVFTELSDGQFSRHPNTDARVKNLREVVEQVRLKQ